MIAPHYEDIRIGAVYEFERTIAESDERVFARLTGDVGGLSSDQVDLKYAVGKKVVHGMLAASFFSTLIDVYSLGPNSLYISQTLQFRKPLFYGDRITVRGTVLDKSDALLVVTLKTEILRGDEVMINGEAKVKLLIW